jgi:hypothetical protein
MTKLKGYKAFDKDMRCRGFQFEVGKEYVHEGEINICNSGFHFCLNMQDCYEYYTKSDETIFCEVEATDKWTTVGDKTVCNKIKILRKMELPEIYSLRNSGKENSGYYNSGYRNSGSYNSGNCNSGYYNSGSYNSGNYNSGYYNSGNYNSGYRNSGNYNSGNYNSGYYNSGNYNSGYRNSGNYNSGNYNSGYFCTNEPLRFRLFNINDLVTRSEMVKINHIISNNFYDKFSVWVSTEAMSDDEKNKYPFYKTTGGYLRQASYKDAWRLMWENLKPEYREDFYRLPKFNWEIFTEITGITEVMK